MIQLWYGGECVYTSTDVDDVMRRFSGLASRHIPAEVWLGHDEILDKWHLDIITHVKEKQLA